MRISLKLSLAAMLAMSAAGSLMAEPWMPSGAKGVGMGSAGVACPEGSQAMLVNPAALGRKDMNRFDLSLPVSIMAGAEGDLIETADKLRKSYDTTVKQSVDNIKATGKTSDEYAKAAAGVISFLTDSVNGAAALQKEGQGVHADIDAHLTTRWKQFGLAAGERVLAGATVVYDGSFTKAFSDVNGNNIISSSVKSGITASTTAPSATATQIWTSAGSSASFSPGQIQTVIDKLVPAGQTMSSSQQTLLTSIVKAVNTTTTATGSSEPVNNDSGLKIKLLQTQEVSLAYAFPTFEDKLLIAPALKIIKGDARASFIRLLDKSGQSKDIADELTEDANAKSSTQFTLDLGMLYLINERWSVGLMGKDLTSPSFDTNIGEDIELKPNVRLGTAFQYVQKPGWRGTLAADVDALKNESSIVVGAEHQEIALGISQELMGWLTLRGGVMSNFGGTNDSTSYSAGLGIQLYRLYLDLGAMLSSDDVTVDGEDYPTAGGFGVTLGWNQNF